MNAIRQEKEEIVSEVAAKLQAAKATVFVEYHGLTVEAMTNLRNDLRAEEVELKVYKNRLVKLAATQTGFEELTADLTGPNAVAFANGDETAAARIIAKYAKKYDVLKFKTGVFEGKVIGVEMLTEIANIPSRETLLTQIAAGLLTPLTEVARGLDMLTEEILAAPKPTPVVEETPVEEVVEEKVEEVVEPKKHVHFSVEEVEKATEAKIEEINEAAAKEIENATSDEQIEQIKTEAKNAIAAVEKAGEHAIEVIKNRAQEALEKE